MAQKYVRDEDAKELERLASEAGVKEADVLTALIWQHGEAAASHARESRKIQEEATLRLKGAAAMG